MARKLLPVIPALSRDPPSLQQQRRKSKILGKIAPRWVMLVNDVILPSARPAFDALFTQNCRVHRLVPLEPDKALDAVALREAVDQPFPMLMDAGEKPRRDSRIEGAV